MPGRLVVLGDKARPQVGRHSKNRISLNVSQLCKQVPAFEDVAAVVNLALKNSESDSMKLVYNKFVSVISYNTTVVDLCSASEYSNSENIAVYEVADGVFEDYAQFNAATRLYSSLVEGFASEMAARRSAMENATKNAQEVIAKLTMQYNRTRQAVITNELVDIITGASAL